MPSTFIGEVVPVEWVQETGFKRPTSFKWNGRVYAVTEVLLKWDDYGFGSSPPKKRTWWMRRHRTCYHVLTDSGQVFEMYWDRSSPKKVWVLVKELEKRDT